MHTVTQPREKIVFFSSDARKGFCKQTKTIKMIYLIAINSSIFISPNQFNLCICLANQYRERYILNHNKKFSTRDSSLIFRIQKHLSSSENQNEICGSTVPWAWSLLFLNESNSNSAASHSYHIIIMICFAIAEDVFQLHKLQQRHSYAPESFQRLTQRHKDMGKTWFP